MKKIMFLLVMFLLLPAFISAETLDFEFDGFAGPYRNVNIADQLNQKFGSEFSVMTIILVETPSLENEVFKEQIKTLDSLNKIEYAGVDVMYVVSCPEEEYKGGYHVSKETAVALSGSKELFRVRLLAGNGEVYHSQEGLMKAEEVVKIIKARLKQPD